MDEEEVTALADPSAGIKGLAPDRPPRWYALKIKPRHEMAVSNTLRAKGLDEFLPLYKERRQWSDRVKEIETPLFAGYTFCRFDTGSRLQVLRVPGVMGVVKFGSELAEVDPRQVDAIRSAAGSGRIVRPCEFLAGGQRIRVVSGPLVNVEGIFERFRGADQLVISVSILQRSVSVELDGDAVVPLAVARRPVRLAAAEGAS